MNPRYAARTAAFAAVYLAAFLASGPLGPALLVPPIAVAALWLVAQSRFGLRRFDVIALTTASMVAATLEGAGILRCLAVAVWAVAPAVLFAVLLERWLPGYWLGHGDRFRRPRASLGRLAGAAALTAVAGLVIQEVTNPGTGSVAAGLQLLRDTAAIVLPILAVRAVRRTRAGRRTRSPRRGALSVVR